MLLWTLLLGLLASLVAASETPEKSSTIKLHSDFLALDRFAKFLGTITDEKTYDPVITRNEKFEVFLFRAYICNGNKDAFQEYVDSFGGLEGCKECQPIDVFHPLFYAYQCRQLKMFDFLIDYGYSVDDPIPMAFSNDDRITPISLKIANDKHTSLRDRFLLAVYDHSKVLFSDYLEPRLKACAVETETGQVVFRNWHQDALTAMANKDFIYIKWLVEERKANVNNYFAGYGSFIHAAVQMNCPNCVRILLLNGADPNEPAHLNGSEMDGWTPLMMAVKNGFKRCTQALLEDPRTRVTQGIAKDPLFTPRHLARKIEDKKQRQDFLKVLHARPADRETLNRWIEDADLEVLTVEDALKRKHRTHLEFLLFNTIQLTFNPKWKSNSPILQEIINAEFS